MWKPINDFTLVNENNPLDFLYIQQNIYIRRIKPPRTFDIIEKGFFDLDAAKKALKSYVGTSPTETTIASILR